MGENKQTIKAGKKTEKSLHIKPSLPSLLTDPIWEKDTLISKIKGLISDSLIKIISDKNQKISLGDIQLDHPSEENYGDFSTNVAMVWGGRLKVSPRELAGKIADDINKYIKSYHTITDIADSKSSTGEKNGSLEASSILEKAEVAGPGFINLRLSGNYLITHLVGLLNRDYGVITSQMSGKKVSVEYTDPNPFKEFHLGHLYSNVIGETVARIFSGVGATVWRADYYGDVGMHVSKSVWGMMEKMRLDKLTLSDLEKLSVNQRQHFLGQGYALGVKSYEENTEIADKIKDINYLIYVAGQEELKKNRGWKPIINYRQYISGRESELTEVHKVYAAGLRWSLEYFETIYKKLGTKFDGYYPESWVGEYGMKLVEQGLAAGVLEKDGETVIFRGEKYGLHTRVFVNKLGLPTYEAKELGLAPAKYEQFKYDLSVIVTGHEIKEYFQVLLKVLRLIKPELGEKTVNLSHGMVKLPEGKMTSRSGNVITFQWLLSETARLALQIMKEADLPEDKKNEVAEIVAVGAVKYSLLKNSTGNDVVFDFEKSVSFEGESGPYLQYTYTRCKSVIRKAEKENAGIKESRFTGNIPESDLNDEELAILRTLTRLEETVNNAARTLSPDLICGFLFDLAQKYNLFYNKHSILGNKDQPVEENRKAFRLALTEATASVLKSSLFLLGIGTVERM